MEVIVVRNVDTRVPAVEGARGAVRTSIRASLPVQALSRILTTVGNTDNRKYERYRDDRQLLLKYHAKRDDNRRLTRLISYKKKKNSLWRSPNFKSSNFEGTYLFLNFFSLLRLMFFFPCDYDAELKIRRSSDLQVTYRSITDKS